MNNPFRTSTSLAFQMMQKNPGRVALTTSGIIIGIAMVVIVLSAGNGVKGLVLGQLSSFGSDWIQVEVKIPSTGKNSGQNAGGQARGVTITTLTDDDARAIRKVPNVLTTYAGVTGQAIAQNGNEKKRPMLFGVSATYPQIDSGTLSEGRFFTDDEDRGAAEVVVLGSKIKEDLFGNDEALQKTVSIDKKSYRVIGIMDERGVTGFFNFDDVIFFPLKTLQKKILAVDHVSWITVKTLAPEKSAATAEEIRSILRERHDITNPDKDDFGVTTMSEATEIVGTIFTGITWLLIALSAISLVVGGVGIMNVMYVSVAERTFEIGLRKAVGATERDILIQFLVEAVLVTVLGGILGMILGIAISYGIAVAARALGYAWEFQITAFSLLLGGGFSTAVGLVFGLYPAKKAASLDPMVAIRTE